jgi:uncharacterized membrane protein YcaP (DUF421 family)
MSLAAIALRCLVAYATLLALLRLSGKRTLADGTAFDFVLALVIGDMVDDLLWADATFPAFAVATATLVAAHAALGIVTRRSDSVRRWVAGRPALLVADGARRHEALRGERVHDRDLAAMLRKRGVGRWAEVESVVLEDSGHPSVAPWPSARPLSRRHAPALRPR